MKKSTFIDQTTNFIKNLKMNFIKKIIVLDEVTSTNNNARELARKGAKEGTIVIAKKQIKGRGRFERLWESPKGGLYLSIVLKPNCLSNKTTILPLLGSLVVSETIDSYNLSTKIKWPNDVLVNGKKIAGILLESEAINKKLEYVILGIGINLNTDINFFSRDIKKISTSIFKEIGKPIDYYLFIKKLLQNFDKYYSFFLAKNYLFIINEWKKKSDTLGRKVKIITTSEQIIGEAYDIDISGFLIINTKFGKQKTITSGDCTYFDK